MIGNFMYGFSNYFNITGYATRKQFWSYLLVNIFILYIFALISLQLFVIFFIISFIPVMSMTVRRFNDIGSNIYFLLILNIAQMVLPFLAFYFIYLLCKKSKQPADEIKKSTIGQKLAFVLLLFPFFMYIYAAKHFGFL